MSTSTATVPEKLATTEKHLIDKPEAARRLSISVKSIDRIKISGRIRIGSRVLFCPKQLAEWVAAGCPQ